MIDAMTLVVFVPAALALAVIPGPNMLFCMARTADGGRRAGLLAALGMVPGPFLGMVAAGAGIAALAGTAPTALTVLRWAGAAYLFWLAWRGLRQTDIPPRPSGMRVVGGGALVSLTNPKGAAFAFAVVPQFIDPANPVLPQALILGTVLAAAEFAVNVAVVLLSARLRAGMPGRLRHPAAPRWLATGVYSGLALRMILSERA